MKNRHADYPKRPAKTRWLIVITLVVAGILAYDWMPRRSRETPPPDNGQTINRPVIGETSGAGTTSGRENVDQIAVADLLARLTDESLSLDERAKAALALARMGTTSALDALRTALTQSSATVRALIAEVLGECPHPEARLLLFSLLEDEDSRVVYGAVRGVARRGDLEAVDVLAGIMQGEDQSETARLAAAEALGSIRDPNALSALAKALVETTDVDLAEHVLDGLGQRPYAEVEVLFRNYLDSAELLPELRVAALEALAEVEGDPSALLVSQAKASDPEVRGEAAWALSATDEPGGAGQEVYEWLMKEEDTGVRRRLYQALGNQAGVSPSDTLSVIQTENSLQVQLAAWQWLAGAFQANPSPEVVAYFHETAVPKLREVALDSGNYHHRLDAVMTLNRAHTPEAVAVLQEIVRSANDERVVRAAQVGL